MPFNEAEDFVRELAIQMEMRKASFVGTYVIDPENLKRFLQVARILNVIVQDVGGKLVDVDITAQTLHGSISAQIPLLDLYKELLKDFIAMWEMVDVFGVSPTTNGDMVIEVSINNVWRAFPAAKTL